MKSDIGLHPVASPVDRISLGATGRMLVWLASSAGRWSGSKGGRLAEEPSKTSILPVTPNDIRSTGFATG